MKVLLLNYLIKIIALTARSVSNWKIDPNKLCRIISERKVIEILKRLKVIGDTGIMSGINIIGGPERKKNILARIGCNKVSSKLASLTKWVYFFLSCESGNPLGKYSLLDALEILWFFSLNKWSPSLLPTDKGKLEGSQNKQKWYGKCTALSLPPTALQSSHPSMFLRTHRTHSAPIHSPI